MLIRQPLFNLDGEPSGDWGDMARSITLDETPADDEQPEMDSDAEGLETEQAEELDAVEPDSNEAKEQEEVPAFNDDTEIDLGNGTQPVKLAELKQGFLRQSDYTKKTQELSVQRKEMETQLEQVKPMQDWLDYAQNNPYLWNQINTAITQWEQTGAADWDMINQDADIAKWVNGFKSEAVKLAKENAELKGKLGDVEFTTGMDKTISDLKADYAELITPEYEAELREQAKAQNLSADLIKKIAKGDLAEKKLQQTQQQLKDAPKKEQAKTVQSLQERRNAQPPQPGRTGQQPAKEVKDVSEMDWLEMAIAVGSKR